MDSFILCYNFSDFLNAILVKVNQNTVVIEFLNNKFNFFRKKIGLSFKYYVNLYFRYPIIKK